VQELVHEYFGYRKLESYKLIEVRGNNFINNNVFSDKASFEFQEC